MSAENAPPQCGPARQPPSAVHAQADDRWPARRPCCCWPLRAGGRVAVAQVARPSRRPRRHARPPSAAAAAGRRGGAAGLGRLAGCRGKRRPAVARWRPVPPAAGTTARAERSRPTTPGATRRAGGRSRSAAGPAAAPARAKCWAARARSSRARRRAARRRPQPGGRPVRHAERRPAAPTATAPAAQGRSQRRTGATTAAAARRPGAG